MYTHTIKVGNQTFVGRGNTPEEAQRRAEMKKAEAINFTHRATMSNPSPKWPEQIDEAGTEPG